jgi:hypothetical protein
VKPSTGCASFTRRPWTRCATELKIYLDGGPPPSEADRFAGSFSYPELRITYLPEGPVPPVSRAFGKFSEAGVYAQTITHPELFRSYLVEQIELLASEYPVRIETGLSTQEIPFSYVLDGAEGLDMDAASVAELVRHFPYVDLASVDDALPNGDRPSQPGSARPLSLFDAARTDYSLQRIRHYTGAPYEDVQDFILFTNYHRYVDAFVDWAVEQIKDPKANMSPCPPPGRCGSTPIAKIRRRGRQRALAPFPDAGLSPDRAQRPRYHAGEYRGRPVERENHHRPSGRAAAGMLADGRPLRRAAPFPAPGRLCAGARLSAL